MDHNAKGLRPEHAPRNAGEIVDLWLARRFPLDGDTGQADELNRLYQENLEMKRLVDRLRAELVELRLAAKLAPCPSAPIETARWLEELDRVAEASQPMVREQADGRGTGLLEMVQRLTGTIRHKDLLLQEIDHRVKNNLLSVVIQLHTLTQRQQNPDTADALRVACTRVQAAQSLHAMLYAYGTAERVDFGNHVQEICAALSDLLGTDGHHRVLIAESESAMLPTFTAQALAVVVNELVTNSFRHAFALEAAGTVRVRVRVMPAERSLQLTVEDDGRGLPDEYDIMNSASFGHRLLVKVADQVGAGLNIEGGGGTRITLTVPLRN